jgi:MOSC domain-containing protein YiiM
MRIYRSHLAINPLDLCRVNKLLSIQIGSPKAVTYKGRQVLTSFFKTPIAGPVRINRLSIEGDTQSDLTVHGGVDKAVYAYSADAYPYWNERYGKQYPWGALGENLTFDTLDEETIGIGDIYDLGQSRLQVTQPRLPCYKLGIRFNDPLAVKAFNDFGRSGVYFKVIKEGKIAIGQELRLVKRADEFFSIAESFRMAMSP